MIIDAYTHLFPQKYLSRIQGLLDPAMMATWFQNKPLCDIEARLETIDAIPDYRQVIANSMPPLETLGSPDETPAFAQLANDGLAEYCATHPNHFAAFVASVPMNNVDAAVAEIDRAVGELGAKGIQIFSNVNGMPLDDPQFFPIFERMAEHDLPIWLHPARTAQFSDYKAEKLSKYAVYFTFGWPYETTVAMTHLVFSALFEKLPNIKVIAHHAGAMVPAFDGRIADGFNDFTRYRDDKELRDVLSKLSRHPSEYYKMFYTDTATFGSEASIRLGVNYFGPERCLFGSDAPFGKVGGVETVTDTIAIVDRLELSAAEREAIVRGNLTKLLRL